VILHFTVPSFAMRVPCCYLTFHLPFCSLNIHKFLSLYLRPHVLPFPLFSIFPPSWYISFLLSVSSIAFELLVFSFLSYVFHFLAFAVWYSEYLKLRLNVKMEKQLKWNDYFFTNFPAVCMFVSTVPSLEQTNL